MRSVSRHAFAVLTLAALAVTPASGAGTDAEWRMYAHDVTGSRTNPDETVLSPSTVGTLHPVWSYQPPGTVVYGTPAVAGGSVYGADIAGNVFALNAATGAPAWVRRIDTVTPYAFQVTSSPLVTDTAVIVGDQGGTVHALSRATGALLWKATPNTHGYPAIWGSPSLARVKIPGGFRTLLLVPVASNEETFVTTQVQPCCSSRGSVAALDPTTGALVWQAYMVSEAEAAAGASGASVWTMPAYDDDLNLVYVTTGNNFGNEEGTPTTDTSDAIVAINAATGAIVWKNQRTPDDTWVTAYPVSDEHPDADFGDSPQITTLPNGTKVVSAGQKSGFMHVVNAATGALVSQQQFLPHGGLGGFFADAGAHNGVIFANGSNWPSFGGEWPHGLVSQFLASPTTSGSVVAIRLTGSGSQQEVWRFTTPGSPMLGAVAIANGVVYVQTTRDGNLVALDEVTGAVLASVPLGASVNGPAISGGRIYAGWGEVTNLGGADPTKGGITAFAP